jgi:zinc transporter ZupT
MTDFISGLIAMGYVTSALFFLKFFRRTADRLFLAFFIAFLLFAAEQGLLAWSRTAREEETWFYLLRLCGFLLIIAGVVDKNRRSDSSAAPS